MPAFTEHSIAAGWNNVGGLVKIGLIVPSSHIAFGEPAANHNYIPPKLQIRLDNGGALVGIDHLIWAMTVTFEQYEYANTTWGRGVYRGPVTVRTRWHNRPFANYNAMLGIQNLGMNKILQGFSNIEFDFSDLRVIV